MEEKKTDWRYRVIRWAVRKLSPKYEAYGLENLPGEPCVFVGNHSQIYGPIAGELYIPGPHAVWCAGEMMHREEVADYAYRDFWSAKPKSVRWFYWLLSRVIPPLSELVFTNAHTVAVYRDARLLTTFRESIALLRSGSGLVIFPEHNVPYNNILCAFQDKFVDLARFYHKKTGKSLCFVPFYLCPALKRVVYCPPLRYRPDSPIGAERKRICDGLAEAITAAALALPEHRVVPYPNIPKKHYPNSRPLLSCAAEDREKEKEST